MWEERQRENNLKMEDGAGKKDGDDTGITDNVAPDSEDPLASQHDEASHPDAFHTQFATVDFVHQLHSMAAKADASEPVLRAEESDWGRHAIGMALGTRSSEDADADGGYKIH